MKDPIYCSRPGCELLKEKGKDTCKGCSEELKPVILGILDKTKKS